MANKTRILIIEDDPDDSSLLLGMLRKAHLERHVKLIEDGARAWEYLEDPQFFAEELVAVFLDLNLPSLGGLQLLGKMLEEPRISLLPVIVMTSSTSPGDLEECKRLGVSSYVRKPITRETFIKAVADSFHLPGQHGRLAAIGRWPDLSSGT